MRHNLMPLMSEKYMMFLKLNKLQKNMQMECSLKFCDVYSIEVFNFETL